MTKQYDSLLFLPIFLFCKSSYTLRVTSCERSERQDSGVKITGFLKDNVTQEPNFIKSNFLSKILLRHFSILQSFAPIQAHICIDYFFTILTASLLWPGNRPI